MSTPRGPTPKGLRRFIRPMVQMFIFAALMLLSVKFFSSPSSLLAVKPLSTVLQEVKAGKVSALDARDGQSGITVTYTDATQAQTQKESNVPLTKLLSDAGITFTTGNTDQTHGLSITIQPESGFSFGNIMQGLFLLLPIGFILYFFVVMRRTQHDPNGMFSFGKSKARLITDDRPSTTFADVAGADGAKFELTEVVDFLTDPTRFTRLGAKIPRGVLLVGPPGTGKTLLARAVAGEAAVPFYSISASEFVEMFVGVGASRVRDLFKQAKTTAPAIIFIDEIDAVGRARGVGRGGGSDEREQTLNQILVEMDGFDDEHTAIVIASTNRPDVLDPALLRPGRFDRRVMLGLPDLTSRAAILAVHAQGKPFASDVDMWTLARQTAGFSGADLANMLNEAAIQAARRDGQDIGADDIEEALDRITMGPARRSRMISADEKLHTAYHEIGHAIVARMLPHVDSVQKITILARGSAGGFTRLVPEIESDLYTQSQIEDRIAFALGGYAVEQIVYAERTSGSESDIETASTLAREMVTRFGMSERLGTLTYGQRENSDILGHSFSHETANYSQRVAAFIDTEVKAVMDRNLARASAVIRANVDTVHDLARLLVEKETLTGLEFAALFDTARLAPIRWQPHTADVA